MSNSFNIVMEEVSPTTPEDLASVIAANHGYGPKRVKTPNLEVEQFDPITIQRARERELSVVPTLNSMVSAIGTPGCAYRGCRPRSRNSGCCDNQS